ncbi:MAG TPA: hypothetical protein VGF55_31490 [Gemmataceae bacterium]|jgi:hypothetical protein
MKARKRTWMPLAGLGLVALAGIALIAGGGSAFQWADRLATERLVSSLDAQATAEVPHGADLPTVVDWFKHRNMVFQYGLGPEVSSPDPDRPGAAFHGIPPGHVANTAIGMTGKRSLGSYHRMYIYFYFDNDGHAIKHVVYAFPSAE